MDFHDHTDTFFALTGAQKVTLSVCVTVRDICEFFTQSSCNLSSLSVVSQWSLSGLSAVSWRSLSSLSAVSQQILCGTSAVSQQFLSGFSADLGFGLDFGLGLVNKQQDCGAGDIDFPSPGGAEGNGEDPAQILHQDYDDFLTKPIRGNRFLIFVKFFV